MTNVQGSHDPSKDDATNKPSTSSKAFEGIVPPRKVQPKAASFIDSLTDRDAMKIDVALVSFFVAGNIDFKECESLHFQNFLKAIRPAYKGPTSTEMETGLLDTAYKETVKMKTVIDDFIPILLVMADDSKLVSMIRNRKNKYLFIDFNSSIEIENPTVELAVETFVQKSVEKVFRKWNIKIYAVVYNLECVLPLRSTIVFIQEEIEFMIFQCQSQNIKLLENRLIDVQLKEEVNELCREFKIVEDDIINLGGTQILFCYSNSWEDFLKSITSCSSNLNIMRQIIGSNKYKFKQCVLHLLFGESLDDKIKEIITFSLKVKALKNDVLNADCTLAKSVERWLQFKTSESNLPYNEIVSNVTADIIKPLSMITNYLHQTYKGKSFMNNDTYSNEVMTYFIDLLSAEGMSDLTKYMNESDIFDKLFKKRITDPIVFWTFAKVDHPQLSKLAIELLQMPACVPCLNSKTMIDRGDLSEETLEKLSSLFYTLKINQS